MMKGRVLLLFLVFSILMWLAGCVDSPAFTPARTDSVGATSEPQIDGSYFGYSEVPAGRIGWFLQLDSKTRSGKLYLPPQILSLRNLVVATDGKVSFQFEDHDQARFEGYVNAGINGKFSYSDGRSFETRLTKIDEKWLTQDYAAFAGLYSNVKFVEEAGDLVGAELLLIPGADGLSGILTQYEGVPGNIYALTNVQTNNGALKFAIVTSDGTQNFTAQLSADKIVLKKVISAGAESDLIALPKRKNLIDALSSNKTTVP